ncbi:TolB family protein [Rhizobium sp. NRK18]|uniref:TolB family protein n=1 Tax=Rhizobium sp. NRK18 TaxID=2964667 RepID=UPI0021C3376C|nr:hypothetical protein [Rhizobium sp. NRK18]MCQ2003872.1 hypothetical protein [Rhizobium sp. NRK18]
MSRRTVIALCGFLGLLTVGDAALAGPADFETPQPVVISGYSGQAMQPFISRDGKYLFFNDRNRPGDGTDIYFATKVDDTHFTFVGALKGLNSTAVDDSASMDKDGNIYFISPRDYQRSEDTLWQGKFADEAVTDVAHVRGDAQKRQPQWINIDDEISADGKTLYFTENHLGLIDRKLESSDILLADRQGDGSFKRPKRVDDLFKNINTGRFEYAPSTSADELTLYFTRADRKARETGIGQEFAIYVATRSSTSDRFGKPERIAAIEGYVEAPSVAPDGCALYFHKQVAGVFRIFRAKAADCKSSE